MATMLCRRSSTRPQQPVRRRLLQLIKYKVAALAFLLLLSCTVQVARAQDLTLTITTPSHSDPDFITWISLLATSLLPPGTPAAFWGAVAAQDVESFCQLVEGGLQTMQASITANGDTSLHQLTLVAIGGCDASESSPVGVEVVYTDDEGTTSAVICDENAFSIGCAIYVTGDEVNQVNDGVVNGGYANALNGSLALRFQHHRKLMQVADPGCRAAAISVGAAVSVYGALNVCPGFGPLALFCVPATIFIGTFAIGMTGNIVCGVMKLATCFPGDSIVLTSDGRPMLMSNLSIGDEIAVRGANGRIAYESIYAFGHADKNAIGMYVRLVLEPIMVAHELKAEKVLHISPLHFGLIMKGDMHKFLRAKDIQTGDIMLIMHNQTISKAQVRGRSIVFMKGLYNPFTMTGTIIVDDVIASVHSDWFLDGFLDSLYLTSWIPTIYQGILTPVRALYHILGRDQYVRLYQYIEKNINIPEVGAKYGGRIGLLVISFPITLLVILMTIYQRQYKEKLQKY